MDPLLANVDQPRISLRPQASLIDPSISLCTNVFFVPAGKDMPTRATCRVSDVKLFSSLLFFFVCTRLCSFSLP